MFVRPVRPFYPHRRRCEVVLTSIGSSLRQSAMLASFHRWTRLRPAIGISQIEGGGLFWPRKTHEDTVKHRANRLLGSSPQDADKAPKRPGRVSVTPGQPHLKCRFSTGFPAAEQRNRASQVLRARFPSQSDGNSMRLPWCPPFCDPERQCMTADREQPHVRRRFWEKLSPHPCQDFGHRKRREPEMRLQAGLCQSTAFLEVREYRHLQNPEPNRRPA